jgi:hypothetical protein
MLKFGGRAADGRRLIGAVLSVENFERAKKGQPIYIEGSDVGVDDVVVVFHVTNEAQADLAAMAEQVRKDGGAVRDLSNVLADRAAVRALGGDPDEDGRN